MFYVLFGMTNSTNSCADAIRGHSTVNRRKIAYFVIYTVCTVNMGAGLMLYIKKTAVNINKRPATW
jgi:hypothetical protein